MASSPMRSTGFRNFLANRSKKWFARSGMSSVRSARSGSVIVITFTR